MAIRVVIMHKNTLNKSAKCTRIGVHAIKSKLLYLEKNEKIKLLKFTSEHAMNTLYF